jgi:hypothetical protein
MSLISSFGEHVLAQPLWLKVWIGWMIVVNTASFAVLSRTAGRATALAWLGNLATMTVLFAMLGYVRLLGLSHVLWWTPLLVFLWRQRPWPATGTFGLWIRILFVTNLVSLVVDYLDVARYLLEGRGATGG